MRKRKIRRLRPEAIPRKRIIRYSKLYTNGTDFQKNIFTGILLIETFYRPLLYRIGEYFATIAACTCSLLLKRQVKSYTIGIGQIGIARILYGCGYAVDPRHHVVNISTVGQLLCVIASFRRSKMVQILELYISQLVTRAKDTFPNNTEEQILYIGELHNGRYSYGLLLVEVLNRIYLLEQSHSAIVVI